MPTFLSHPTSSSLHSRQLIYLCMKLLFSLFISIVTRRSNHSSTLSLLHYPRLGFSSGIVIPPLRLMHFIKWKWSFSIKIKFPIFCAENKFSCCHGEHFECHKISLLPQVGLSRKIVRMLWVRARKSAQRDWHRSIYQPESGIRTSSQLSRLQARAISINLHWRRWKDSQCLIDVIILSTLWGN